MVGLLPSQGVGSRTAVRSEIKPSGPPDSYDWVQTLPMSGLGLGRLLCVRVQPLRDAIP